MSKFYPGDEIKIKSNVDNRNYGVDYENKTFKIKYRRSDDEWRHFREYNTEWYGVDHGGGSWVLEEDLELVEKNYFTRPFYQIKDFIGKIKDFKDNHEDEVRRTTYFIIFLATLAFFVFALKYADKEITKQEALPEKEYCMQKQNLLMEDLPAKCVKYFYNK